jgi:hypothetical protein
MNIYVLWVTKTTDKHAICNNHLGQGMANSTNTTCFYIYIYIHPGLSSSFLMIRGLDILFSFLYVTLETNLSIASRRSQGRMDGSC